MQPTQPMEAMQSIAGGPGRRRGDRAGRRTAAAALALGVLLAATGASAADGASDELGVTGPREDAGSAPPPEPVESVALDQLLKLPSSMEFDRQKRNGISSDAWRARFRASFEAIRAAEEQVAETRAALDEMAGSGGGGQWQMAPPGASNTEVTPLSFKLREELRERRAALEAAQQKHRDLVIQADLADVPEAWRQPD